MRTIFIEFFIVMDKGLERQGGLEVVCLLLKGQH